MPVSRPTRLRGCFGVLALWIGAAPGAWAADLQVIANRSVKATEVSLEELRGIFLETRTSLPDGSHVEPILLKGGSVHELFARHFLGKSDTALGAYYRSLVFTGKALMPKELGSEREMVAYVARTKGAIGYVSAAVSVEGVKVLDIR